MARNFDDASSQCLEFAGAAVTALPLTLACWFRSDDAAANQTLIALGRSGTSDDRYQLRANGSTAGDPVQALHVLTGVAETAATSVGYSVNTWHHAAGVFTSTSSRSAYIDGGSVGNNTNFKAAGTVDRTTIGAINSAGTRIQFMSGRIAEAAAWNVALTAGEIAALAKGVSPRYIRPGSLVGYWPVWGLLSPEHDLTSNARVMTVSGATAANHAPVAPFSRQRWGTYPFMEEGVPPGGGTGQPMWKRAGHITNPVGIRWGRGF